MVVVSGSVALLGDTLHNFADALTAIPLGIAFLLGRRAATRSYTYGYGRAEDLAGHLHRAHHRRLGGLGRLPADRPAAAPADWSPICRSSPRRRVVGFLGNEWVARYRIRSAGGSARPRWSPTGCTPAPTGSPRWPCCSAPAVWRWAGSWADPVVGLLITAAILLVLKDAAREVYRRLMDAVDPALIDSAEDAVRGDPGSSR